jgi:hypothetical protein
MRELTLSELNRNIEETKKSDIIKAIDELVESNPSYKPGRRRPKSEVEARILQSFQYQ